MGKSLGRVFFYEGIVREGAVLVGELFGGECPWGIFRGGIYLELIMISMHLELGLSLFKTMKFPQCMEL